MKKNVQRPHERMREKMDRRPNLWLCEKTGIGPSEISRILRGILKPSESQLKKISIALGEEFKMEE